MIKIKLHTNDAQIYLEDKIMDFPESPVIGDSIFLGNLFNVEEYELAFYEASKNQRKLEGIVTERMWFLDHEKLEYILQLTLKLKQI